MSEVSSLSGKGSGSKKKHKSSPARDNKNTSASPQAVSRPQKQPGPSSCPPTHWGSPSKWPCRALSQAADVLPHQRLPSKTGNAGLAPAAASSSLTQEGQQELSSGAASAAETPWSVAFSLWAFQEPGVGPASLGHGQPSCISDAGWEERAPESSSQAVVPQSPVPAGSSHPLTSQGATRKICEMVIMSGLKLSFVENPGFHDVLNFIAPWYEPPSCDKLCETILPSLYRSAVDFVKSQLAQVKGQTVHFTVDIWTCSQSERGYMSLTAHWWQPEDAVGRSQSSIKDEKTGRRAGYCQALLHAKVVDLEDVVAGLPGIVEQQIEAWISRDVARGFMVTDGGPEVSAAVSNVCQRHIQCTVHLLDLVMNDALGFGSTEQASWDAATRDLRRLLEDCRRIGAHFNSNREALYLLEKKQEEANVPDDLLIDDVPTCWSTVYAMIECLLEQRNALHLVAEVADLLPGERPLSFTEWQTLSQTRLALKLFKDCKVMLGLPTSSLSLVVPSIHLLQDNLATFSGQGQDGARVPSLVAALVQRLQRAMEVHLLPLMQEPAYMLATLCNPRFKGSVALRDNALPRWRAELTRRVRDLQAEKGTAIPAEVEEGALLTNPSASNVSHLAALEAKAVQWTVKWAFSRNKGHETEDWAEKMVREYLEEPETPDADPLSYWARKEAVWPALSLMAQELLSCPATRVQSKEVFSHRDTYSDLSISKFEELVFLKVNLPFFGFPELAFESE